MKYYYYIIKDGLTQQISWSKYYYVYRFNGEERRRENRIYIILDEEDEDIPKTSDKLKK